MRRASLLFLFFTVGGCVSRTTYREDVLAAYRKGLKVGHVIGRDEIIFALKRPDCFQQRVDDLTNPSNFDKSVQVAEPEKLAPTKGTTK